jgi:GNAT superfamily N-acetyltransferase
LCPAEQVVRNSEPGRTGGVQNGVMVEFGVRSGVPADLPVVADIFRRASLSNSGDASALRAHPEALLFADDALIEGRTRVATRVGDRVVGFATMLRMGGTFELEDMFVDPEWKRRGIGRLLVHDAMVIARHQNVPRIDVTANPHAFAFYENVGFVHDGRVQTPFGHGSRMHIDIAKASQLSDMQQ